MTITESVGKLYFWRGLWPDAHFKDNTLMQTFDFSAVPTDAAERLVMFLNSHGVGFDAHRDMLDAAVAPADSAAFGYPGVPFPTAAELTQARTLRTLLLEGIGGAALWAGPALNRIAATLPWVYQFGADGVATPAPQQPQLAAWVLRDLALVSGAGHWKRIKVCADEACGALFYDTTRGQTRRWHSFELCGNKANVAAHRQRRQEPEA